MLYKKEVLQIHNTIKKSGNGSKLEIIAPLGTDAFSGISTEEVKLLATYVQVQYSAEDLSNGALAHGLTKLLISPVDDAGVPLPDFVKLLKNKKTYIRLTEDGKKLSVKMVNFTLPDNKTPFVARVFVGG